MLLCLDVVPHMWGGSWEESGLSPHPIAFGRIPKLRSAFYMCDVCAGLLSVPHHHCKSCGIFAFRDSTDSQKCVVR